ncbi:MAG: hypothetical protein LBB78_00345 [Spirochaetaceae bacterium]|jgi:hypothetical protein|nr:hypothetical protein [Spirochaetaceae bacterium]
MRFFPGYTWLIAALTVGQLYYYSCSKQVPLQAEAEVPPDGTSASTQWISPLVILKPGENPLWFELGREGPELVDSPDAASLKSFEPWPLARWITGFLTQEDRLVGVVNRSGFLAFIPGEDGDLALYSVTDVLDWENYTAASPFLYQNTPAVLLYQNDFFEESRTDPPDPPVRGLVKGSSKPVGLDLPALESLSSGEGRETADAIRLGKDGYWYYRGVNRGRDNPVYFRSRDFTGPGESVSAASFRSASEPSPLKEAPALLGRILEEAFRLREPGMVPMAAVTFAESGGIRYFSETSPLAEGTGGFVELSGYYRTGDTGDGRPASSWGLVLFPGGKGIYGKLRDGAIETQMFTLPALPEKFSYTGIGLSGSAIIALWEEREGLNVGAAGFMVTKMP